MNQLMRTLLILLFLICNVAESVNDNYEWCPMSACPYYTSTGEDLCQKKWLFLIHAGTLGKQGCGDLCDTIRKLGNLTEIRGNNRQLNHLFYYLGILSAKVFSQQEKGGWRFHNFRNMNNLYNDLQKLVIKTFSYSTNDPNVVLGLSSSSDNDPNHYEKDLHNLKKAFPCSKVLYYGFRGVMTNAFYAKIARVSRVYPQTAATLFFEDQKIDHYKVTALMKFIGIEGCVHTKEGGFEGKCFIPAAAYQQGLTNSSENVIEVDAEVQGNGEVDDEGESEDEGGGDHMDLSRR